VPIALVTREDVAAPSGYHYKPVVIVATGRYPGEGFDDNRLDTLFFTMPISWRGTLAQCAGRLHRLHTAKREYLRLCRQRRTSLGKNGRRLRFVPMILVAILVHINADHLLRNHRAGIIRVCGAGPRLLMLGDKIPIHRFDNDRLDVGCGNAGDRSDGYCLGVSLEMRHGHVIAVTDSSFGGVGRDHAVAGIVVQQARKDVASNQNLSFTC
jgi:hypothetical protein